MTFAQLAETKQQLLHDFYQQWQHEALVVNQWFAVQASVPSSTTVQQVKGLLNHESFTLKNRKYAAT